MFSRMAVMVFCLFILSSCGDNYDETVELNKIKSLIEKETSSWADRDYENWASTWIHDDKILWIFIGDDGYYEHTSWQLLDESIKGQFEASPSPLDIEISWSDWNIHIYGDGAFASYIQKVKFGEDENDFYKCREARVLEKLDGSWKLVYMSAINFTSYQNEDNMVEK